MYCLVPLETWVKAESVQPGLFQRVCFVIQTFLTGPACCDAFSVFKFDYRNGAQRIQDDLPFSEPSHEYYTRNQHCLPTRIASNTSRTIKTHTSQKSSRYTPRPLISVLSSFLQPTKRHFQPPLTVQYSPLVKNIID
jgi:hypothetical protein